MTFPLFKHLNAVLRYERSNLPQEMDSSDGSCSDQDEAYPLCVCNAKDLSCLRQRIKGRKEWQKRIREETHLSIVVIKEDWSTDGSMPSVGSQGPPVAINEWSFLRTANFNMLQIWGIRSSNNLSEERSSRAVLLRPLIKIIWTTEKRITHEQSAFNRIGNNASDDKLWKDTIKEVEDLLRERKTSPPWHSKQSFLQFSQLKTLWAYVSHQLHHLQCNHAQNCRPQ